MSVRDQNTAKMFAADRVAALPIVASPGPPGGVTPVPGVAGVFELPLATAALVVAALLVVVAARQYGLSPSDRVVLAFVPWVAVAASLTVLADVVVLPAALATLFDGALSYLVAFVLGGAVWVATADTEWADWTPTELVALTGVLLFAPIAGGTLAMSGRELHPLWPVVALLAAVALTMVTWGYLREWVPQVGRTGELGIVVLFGHLLDATTTLVGIDLLGFAEQTPLPRAMMEFAATLPTADLLGVGWLFLVFKLLLAVAVLFLAGVGSPEPSGERNLFLGLVAASGLGPGVHNLVLYVLL